MDPLTASLLTMLHKLIGGVLVVAGLVLFPMPIPIGAIMIAIGLLFLAPYFKPIQKLVRTMRQRFEPVNKAMLSIKTKCPPVIRKAIEKTAP